MDTRFVKRPIAKGVIAFVTIPGSLTGAGLTLGAVRATDAPLGLRIALLGMGAVFLLACLAIVFSHSGLHLDRRARTITMGIRVFGWRTRRQSIVVADGDRVVVETAMVGMPAPYPNMPNSSVVLIGPAGRRWLIGTRTAAESERVAREVAEFIGVPR